MWVWVDAHALLVDLHQGVLHLTNTADGSEHVYQLRGVAERPLAQEHVVLKAQAKQRSALTTFLPTNNVYLACI